MGKQTGAGLWRLAGCVVAAALAGILGLGATPASASLALSPEQCPRHDTLSPAERAQVACGFLAVPESADRPGGRMLRLAVAVIAPEGPPAGPPLLVLHGGPGGGFVEGYAAHLGPNAPFPGRQVVLFDQRAAGLSEPALCPDLNEARVRVAAQGLGPADQITAMLNATSACRVKMEREGVDLTGYSTVTTVGDIERLRAALGIGQWDVYGISYGTTVALAYMAAHPGAIRAVVLDSVYLPTRPGFSGVILDFRESVLALAATCASQPACAQRFGDLEALLIRATEATAADPLVVPGGGDPAAIEGIFRISAPTLLTVVHQILYDTPAYPIVPMLLERAAAGDGEVFAALVSVMAERGRNVGVAGYNAVECAERFPHDDRAGLAEAARLWPMITAQTTLIVSSLEECKVWNAPPVPLPPMPRDVAMPVLVLAGGLDPITRPRDSREAARLLGANAVYVEVPYAGHGARRPTACSRGITAAFLADPAQRPDTACLKDLPPPVFVTAMVRAPLLGVLAQWLEGGDPVVLGSLAVPLVLLLLALVFPLGGAIAVARGGGREVSVIRAPGLLAVSALLLLAALGLLVMSAAETLAATPYALMFGLLPSAQTGSMVAWAAMAIFGVALLRLATGAPRSAIGRVLFALVALGVLGTLAGLFALGLLVPRIL